MRVVLSQFEEQNDPEKDQQPGRLMTAKELRSRIGMSVGWIYKHTMRDTPDPLPVVRFGEKAVRFDPDRVMRYIRAHERHRPGATLDTSDGIARVNQKEKWKLTRKRLQTGSVRLREDGDPAWCEGFYREDVMTAQGKKVRMRRAVNLGTAKELSEKAARQRLAAILEPINQAKCKPKTLMTFREFLANCIAVPLEQGPPLVSGRAVAMTGNITMVRVRTLSKHDGFVLRKECVPLLGRT